MSPTEVLLLAVKKKGTDTLVSPGKCSPSDSIMQPISKVPAQCLSRDAGKGCAPDW